MIVLVELWWVLKRLYGIAPDELRSMVQDIVDARQFLVEQRNAVGRILRKVELEGIDFADGLIFEVAIQAGCDRVVSFDHGAVKAGMKQLG